MLNGSSSSRRGRERGFLKTPVAICRRVWGKTINKVTGFVYKTTLARQHMALLRRGLAPAASTAAVSRDYARGWNFVCRFVIRGDTDGVEVVDTNL